jgi:tRNA (cytidine/uridine-2'-O-)-methyltransferase
VDEFVFHIALFEPRIPHNTGNIIRLAANTGCHLHLIEPLGFDLEEKSLRRAGLDYHDLAELSVHENYPAFAASMAGHRTWAITTRGKRYYEETNYQHGDILLFGSETAGLSMEVRESIHPDHHLRIPMQPGNRSLNLSNAVAIVTYEAWRQLGFCGAD